MRILCVGINHKTADLAIRERLAFDEQDARRAMRMLRQEYAQAEFVILGTCNRSELYCARPVHGHPRESEFAEFLGRFHNLPHSAYMDNLYAFTDAEAVRHLFRVASGLDSMVLGENQILSQVKSAYTIACEEGATGRVFNPLFQLSLNVAKHVQGETDIAAGRVSVAGVAIDFAAQTLGDLSNARVLNVGAGKMNALMLRRLGELGCQRFVVVNRSPEHARELADRFGGQAAAMSELADHLAEADVVVTSTGSPEPIITRAMVQAAQARRQHRPLLIVDIAVPRDVACEVGSVEGVRLYNIDDLSRAVETSVHLRRGQLDRCETIIEEHVREFTESMAAREVTPTIQALRRHILAIAEEELASAVHKLSAHDDAPEDERILKRVLHRVVQRILHKPAENLRRHSGTESARMHAAALRKLFDLDEED